MTDNVQVRIAVVIETNIREQLISWNNTHPVDNEPFCLEPMEVAAAILGDLKLTEETMQAPGQPEYVHTRWVSEWKP